MSPDQFKWEPNPAILAADLAEFEALSMRDADAFRRLYLNEFVPEPPIEVSPAQYHELATAKSYHLAGLRREWRTHRGGDRALYIDGRRVVVVHAAGGGGSDDGGSDDDRTPPAVRYRPAHGGRLPSPVSVH